MALPVGLLNAFVVFSDSRNITEAAGQLKMSQPALSKQLRQLEEMLPAPIFAFSGRKKILTPFGRDLHRRLKLRLGDLQEIVRESWTLHTLPERNTLRIAGRRGILDRMSGKLKFGGSLIFLESSNDQVIQSLLSLEAEIGVMHRIPDTHELTVKSLFKEEFQLAIPKSFVSGPPSLNAALFRRLGEKPCLGYKTNDEILAAACAAHGLKLEELRMARATESYPSLAEMVEAKFGWTVLPSYLKLSESKVWSLPLSARMLPARHFFAVYRPEFASVPWFKELIADMQRSFTGG